VVASASWGRNGFDSAVTAEAYAIYAGMQLALECGLQNLIFGSDCESVINKLKQRNDVDRSYLSSILQEI
jgi:hypothetical protein